MADDKTNDIAKPGAASMSAKNNEMHAFFNDAGKRRAVATVIEHSDFACMTAGGAAAQLAAGRLRLFACGVFGTRSVAIRKS